jgi:serine/threonine protein kinase
MGDMSDLPQISGYRVLEELGRQDTGRLFKARQLSLNRFVALKVLEEAADEKLVERFLREARSAARLRHPNVVALHNIGTCPDTGLRYLAFEFVQGAVSLKDYLTKHREKLSEPKALGIALGICEALVCAEENRIVHRDVRPEKIYVDDLGIAKLADLGLAKRLDVSGKTIAGTRRIGSPFYTAPEIASEGATATDSRADLYGLGITLYRMLAGCLPYAELPVLERIEALERRGLRPVKGAQPPVNALIRRLAAWDPEDRYPTAREAVEELRRLAPKPRVTRSHQAQDYLLETGRIRPAVRFTVRVVSGDKTLVDKTVGVERVVLGRSSSATVLVDDPRISRKHVELLFREGKVELTPLSTSNTTKLNGKLLRNKAYLHPDDELVLSERFRVHVSWEEPEPEPELELELGDEDDIESPGELGETDDTVRLAKKRKPKPAAKGPSKAAPSASGQRDEEQQEKTVPISIPPPPPSLEEIPPRDATVRLPPPSQPADGDATATLASGAFKRDDSLGIDAGLLEDGGGTSASIPIGLDAQLFELPPGGERPLPPPGWLVFADGRRVALSRLVQIGSGAGCEVRLPKAVGPRKAAIVVRCAGGHRLVNVADDVGQVTLNDGVVPDQAPLEGGDRLRVCGVSIAFETPEE